VEEEEEDTDQMMLVIKINEFR